MIKLNGWIDPSDGYPAHTCGGPMVPASLYPSLRPGFGDAGARRDPGRALLCLWCGALVSASPEERIRAACAAKRERDTRAA